MSDHMSTRNTGRRPVLGSNTLPRISVPARVKSPAEEARDQADATGAAFVAALEAVLRAHGIEPASEELEPVDALLGQLRADEYEAGFATGHAAGLAVGERNAKARNVSAEIDGTLRRMGFQS